MLLTDKTSYKNPQKICTHFFEYNDLIMNTPPLLTLQQQQRTMSYVIMNRNKNNALLHSICIEERLTMKTNLSYLMAIISTFGLAAPVALHAVSAEINYQADKQRKLDDVINDIGLICNKLLESPAKAPHPRHIFKLFLDLVDEYLSYTQAPEVLHFRSKIQEILHGVESGAIKNAKVILDIFQTTCPHDKILPETTISRLSQLDGSMVAKIKLLTEAQIALNKPAQHKNAIEARFEILGY